MRYLLPLALFAITSSHALAQCAGCGADYNRADRIETEHQRIQNADPPVRSDPVGNALLSGGATGIVRGSAAAAAGAFARSVGIGAAIDAAHRK